MLRVVKYSNEVLLFEKQNDQISLTDLTYYFNHDPSLIK